MIEVDARTNGRLMKPAEVADVLNISRALAYRLIRAGEIPAVRISHAVRVRPADLAAYLQRCRTTQAEEIAR